MLQNAHAVAHIFLYLHL